ncbi:alpha/beta hydrolase [Nocardioides montaniterrae]
MSTVTLPAKIGELPVMECQPIEAGQLGTDLRTVAAELQNVSEWADGRAAPIGWKGDAAQAAQHAGTRFARRADLVEEALQLATVATTKFEDRLVRLRQRRETLEAGRAELNQDIETLRGQIARRELDDEQAQERARHLTNRATLLSGDISAWIDNLADAERTYIAALRGIDTAPEVRSEVAAQPLPDAASLLKTLRGLTGRLAALTAWWRSLTVAQRQALMVAYPGVIGSTDGIPITGRDRANRANIGAMLGYLHQREEDGQLTPAEKQALHNLEKVQSVIKDHSHQVDPVTGRGLFNIIKYDPYAYGGDGSSVVSLGNPDHAANVATYTPGLTSHGGELSDIGRIGDLYDQMSDQGAGSVSTILYLDYDAPSLDGFTPGALFDPDKFGPMLDDLVGVTDPAAAQVGGHHLAGFLNSLDVTNSVANPEVTVIGHSYGSEVAAYAVHEQPSIVDNAALLANPGLPGHNVHDLVGNSGIHVYVGADDHDPVSLLGSGPLGGPGNLGADGAAASYGADRIPEDPSPESASGVLGFGNHQSDHYLGMHDDGTPTRGLQAVATLATGGHPDLVPGRTADNYESLGDLVKHGAADALPGPVRGGLSVLAHTPTGEGVRFVWDHTPDGVKLDIAKGGLYGLDGAVHVADGGLHVLDGAAQTLSPISPVAGLLDHGLDAITPAADGLAENADHLVGHLVGLLR